MENYPFRVVDVFGTAPWLGNPVLVVLLPGEPSGCGIAPSAMQRFAAWNGQPETVFLWAGSDRLHYHVRIHSPLTELGFAGHPTLGALHVALEEGIVDAQPGLRQVGRTGEAHLRWQHRCGQRLLGVRSPVRSTVQAIDDSGLASIGRALSARVAHAWRVSTGAQWIIVRLDTCGELESLRPDFERINALSVSLAVSGITVYAEQPGAPAPLVEVRSFGPAIGVLEDAFCGGGQLCVAAVRMHLAGRPVAGSAHQGRFVGRDGVAFLDGSDGDGHIWIDGHARDAMAGTVRW